LGIGAFSPLTGFLGERDYNAVVETMRLADGTVWPLPVTLAVDETEYADVREGERLLLRGEDGKAYAVLTVESRYRPDKRREAVRVFGTEDPSHPGVNKLFAKPAL
ncbi:sulfate adenylyltransferase, partial [Anoxybacillus sp. LAT_38]|nr:sulfate adenylyltransferase [Anoxybacillus sp. LAT_38]